MKYKCLQEAADACCEPKWGENFIPYTKTFPIEHTVQIAYFLTHLFFWFSVEHVFHVHGYMKNITECLFVCFNHWVTILVISKLLAEEGWGDRVSEMTMLSPHNITEKKYSLLCISAWSNSRSSFLWMRNIHILGKIWKDFFILLYTYFQRQSIFFFPTKTVY